MFWGCFSYDVKGPCHIWNAETAQEKRQAEAGIDKWKEEREPECRRIWELETAMRRVNLRGKPPGKTPKWVFKESTGKLVRRGRTGIDWYRYQKEILHAKLIPFAMECKQARPGTFIQEDNAPAHAHFFQQTVYSAYGIERLLWPGNSPDLNMIEPAWPWLKRQTTKTGAPKVRHEMVAAWRRSWRELAQDRIQKWIERIPRHIERVIELEGGNCYREGRMD